MTDSLVPLRFFVLVDSTTRDRGRWKKKGSKDVVKYLHYSWIRDTHNTKTAKLFNALSRAGNHDNILSQQHRQAALEKRDVDALQQG